MVGRYTVVTGGDNPVDWHQNVARTECSPVPDDKMRDLEAAVIEDHTLDSPNLVTVTNDLRSNIYLNHHFFS
jgi:hypothetical protein